MEFDTLIKGGTIVDGTGRLRYDADVGVKAGKIAAIGQLGNAAAAREIDASGLVVAPGFIDMHSHSDMSLFEDPGGESKVHQGVTTEVTGNCSFSPFPAGRLGEGGLREAMGTILRSQAPWTWSSLDGWAEATESAGVSLNLAPLVGHGAIRVAAGVNENRPPTPDELAEICRTSIRRETRVVGYRHKGEIAIIEIDFDRVLRHWEALSTLTAAELKSAFYFDEAYQRHERAEIAGGDAHQGGHGVHGPGPRQRRRGGAAAHRRHRPTLGGGRRDHHQRPRRRRGADRLIGAVLSWR